MIRTFLVAALAAVLLPAGQAAAAEEVYAPYYACMATCQSEESSCMDHIAPGSPDQASLQAECANIKAGCVQECQFLPIPGQGGEGGQQNQGQGEAVQQGEPQREEAVQQQEPAQDQPVQHQEQPVQHHEQPRHQEHQEPAQVEQPAPNEGVQQGGAQQEGAGQGQQEPTDTLNGTIRIYRFE